MNGLNTRKRNYVKGGIEVAGSSAKKFGTSMFGFKKADVNAYLERVIREFDQRLKEREEENSVLKSELNDLRLKYDQLSREADSLIKEKEKIAGVLLQAHEKAETMIKEAQDNALKEKMRLDQLLETEKEKIVDIKQELKQLRTHIIDILSKYEKQIDEVISNIENREKNYIQIEVEQKSDENNGYAEEYEYANVEEDRAG